MRKPKRAKTHKIVKGLEEAVEYAKRLPVGIIRGPALIKVSESEMPFTSVETTMVSLERAIDGLIQRINAQTKRIKEMM